MRLLLVELCDDTAARIGEMLGSMGHSHDRVATVESALIVLGMVAGYPGAYGAILIDPGAVDDDGQVLLQAIRAHDRHVPIIVIADTDRNPSLDTSNAICMVKPLDFDALAARLDHWLNRDVGQIRLGNLVYDPATRHLECRRKILLLPARERDLADLLFRRVGQTVPRAMVEHQLYGVGSDHGSNVVDVLIHRLRRRLIQAEAGVMIRTLRGAGLTMAPADQITCDKPR